VTCFGFWTAACVEGYSLDSVYDYVEAMMMNMEPITATLRMLALISLCNGGIPRKTFDALRREFLHVRRPLSFPPVSLILAAAAPLLTCHAVPRNYRRTVTNTWCR
jgi:hypothetical protein